MSEIESGYKNNESLKSTLKEKNNTSPIDSQKRIESISKIDEHNAANKGKDIAFAEKFLKQSWNFVKPSSGNNSFEKNNDELFAANLMNRIKNEILERPNMSGKKFLDTDSSSALDEYST